MTSTELLDVDRTQPTSTPTSWRREFYLTVLIIAFTMTQLWAAIVLLTSDGGPTPLAIGLSLGGGLVTMIRGWIYLARQNRFHVDL